VLAGTLPRPSGKLIRRLLIALLVTFGTVLGLIGFIQSTWVDFALMVLLGLGNGYVTIILFTSMQSRTPKTMMGRIMSLLTLSSIGLVPVSQALSGTIIAVNLTLLFVLAGLLIVVVAFWTAVQPALGTFSETVLAEA
jgi:MFS family permease